MSAWSSSGSSYSDEEVAVVAGGRRLWVRGVRGETSCGELVAALRCQAEWADEPEDTSGEWVLAERWRGVERPLPPDAAVLSVLNAWGDARHEVRLSLRFVETGCDSGRDSEPSTRGGRRRRGRPARPPTPPPAAKLATIIAHQSRTIHQQIDKLREQEKQIDHLEDQAHKTRMEKHGCNYLLESYLRDLGRCNEVTDSQGGNSDSGVGGGSGTPPRRQTKHRSRRERHLMREHYFTKELTDICQINSERLTQKTTNDSESETSGDELSKIREEIEVWEKMAIINKRLQREEELLVRLGAKLKRYLNEEQATYCENKTQMANMIEKVDEEMDLTNKEIETNAAEIEKANAEINRKTKLLNELSTELEQEELETERLEYEFQLSQQDKMNEFLCQTSDFNVNLNNEDASNHLNNVVFYNCGPSGYPLDTLV